MFFKHQDMRDDLIYKPEWTSSVPTLPGILGSCPYAELKKSALNLLGL